MAAGVRKKPTQGGLYQGFFTDFSGKRRYFTAPSKKKAREWAYALEKNHREIRDGHRPPPKSPERERIRSFEEIVTEYTDWGESQGGKRGRPWSEKHAQRRRAELRWWQRELSLALLADLEGILPRAEKALRGLQELGRAGKTIANYAEGLSAFCDWCVQRGYLAGDPLKGLAPFDTTPKVQRRAMTPEEIKALLAVAPPHRSLLYETAFLSGLRANELRSLRVEHLDVQRCGLQLEPEWTKNRRPGFQPLPAALVLRLKQFVATGEADRLYKDAYRRGQAKKALPEHPCSTCTRSQQEHWGPT